MKRAKLPVPSQSKLMVSSLLLPFKKVWGERRGKEGESRARERKEGAGEDPLKLVSRDLTYWRVLPGSQRKSPLGPEDGCSSGSFWRPLPIPLCIAVRSGMGRQMSSLPPYPSWRVHQWEWWASCLTYLSTSQVSCYVYTRGLLLCLHPWSPIVSTHPGSPTLSTPRPPALSLPCFVYTPGLKNGSYFRSLHRAPSFSLTGALALKLFVSKG